MEEKALTPRFARTWPEKPQETVTVICEGPSAYFEREALRRAVRASAGPVVAVNRAIALSCDVPIDMWATTDDPEKGNWDTHSNYMPDGCKLFSVECNLLQWERVLGGEWGKLYLWHNSYMDELADAEEPCPPLVPTLFPLLAWLLSQGVKDLRLIGCDMKGTHSPFIMEHYDHRADRGHELRWIIEREMLAHSIRHYRAKGARITRWNTQRTGRK